MVSNDWLDRPPVDPLADHVRDVVDKTWNFSGRVKDHKDDLINAVLGLGGESGEVIDIVKKTLYHKEKNRREELLLELGDVCYYLAKIMDIYGFTLDEVLEANKKKLFERYEIGSY